MKFIVVVVIVIVSTNRNCIVVVQFVLESNMVFETQRSSTTSRVKR